MNNQKALLAILLALILTVSMQLPAYADWVLKEAEYDADGNLTHATYVFSNGGEDFDKDSLTWEAIPQWKIDLINAQPLNPRTTGHEELDRLVRERLDRILSPEMTNFQKLRTIYNDQVANFTYDVPIYGPDMQPNKANPPSTSLMCYRDCVYGVYLLRNKAGVCDEFSAAFVAMANAVGFEAYTVGGTVSGNGHRWSLIRMGDEYYIFDSQAEQVNIRSNHVGYKNFCLAASSASGYQMGQGRLEEQKAHR